MILIKRILLFQIISTYNKSDNFLFYTIRCIVANDDETSPTEPKYEEDLEFGVCHLNLILFIFYHKINELFLE